METTDWFLVFGPLVGVIVGGSITSIAKLIEVKHSRKVALQDARLKRLESISDDLHKVQISATLWTAQFKLAIDAKNVVEAANLLAASLDLCISISRRVETYVPSLRPQSQELVKKATLLSHAGSEMAFAKPDALAKSTADHSEAMKAFVKASSDLILPIQKEIYALIK